MSVFCPNIKSEAWLKHTELVGNDLNYLSWIGNKGFAIQYTSKGKVSSLYSDLVKEYKDEKLAAKIKALTFSKSIIEKLGNVKKDSKGEYKIEDVKKLLTLSKQEDIQKSDSEILESIVDKYKIAPKVVFKEGKIVVDDIEYSQSGIDRSNKGAIIYSTQGTGKSTLVKQNPEKYTDGDELTLEFLKEEGIDDKNTTSQNAGNVFKKYRDSLTKEEQNKLTSKILDKFNKEKAKGKIVLTSNRFIRENPEIADEIYLSEDAEKMEAEFIKRGGNPENAKKIVQEKLNEQRTAFDKVNTKPLKKGEYISDKLKSDGTKITEQDIEQNPTFYQNNTNQTTEEFVASEKTIRDLAARMSDRIGIPVRFESDRTKKYKGKLENGTAVINLAHATLDTAVHEIFSHPILRVLKLQSGMSAKQQLNKEVEQGSIEKKC